jgi:predicted CXXCH cytochrome family protein
MPVPLFARRRGLWIIAAALTVALAATAYFAWPRSDPARRLPAEPAPLPPLTESPFLNTKPGVAYVGDQRCAACHAEESRAYHQHPMGRSLFTTAAAPPMEQYDTSTRNPFQSGPFHYEVVRKGARVIHKEWCEDASGKVVAQLEAEMAYALGSGTQARSYLWQRDGFLCQSPITWYTHPADGRPQWGLSPNYEMNPLHFHRRIDSRCVYCHCQEARPIPATVNRYEDPPFGQLAIGCERCHGPGALHVAERGEGAIDRTIVNPRHLEPALREAICEQCHLQGEDIVVRRGRLQSDYRPGLPLEDYVTVFVRTPEAADPQRIVTHVEQMRDSVCFQKSGGKFGCTSCHDPHRQPAAVEVETHYRQRCLTCHGAPDHPNTRRVEAPTCSLPLAKRRTPEVRDNCIHCHMPRNASSNVTHLAVTDHRVPRRPGGPPTPPAVQRLGELPLVAFHRRPDDAESRRDLALGLSHQAVMAEGFQVDDVRMNAIRGFLTRRALPLLDEAAVRAPNDLPVLEARGLALLAQGRAADALDGIQDAIAQAPDREETLAVAMEAADAAQRLDLAASYGEQLVRKYPQTPYYAYRLAVIHAKREAWPQARAAAQAAVDGDPFRAQPRALLVTTLIEIGDRARAEAEFAVLGVIDPKYHAEHRTWFMERLKK